MNRFECVQTPIQQLTTTTITAWAHWSHDHRLLTLGSIYKFTYIRTFLVFSFRFLLSIAAPSSTLPLNKTCQGIGFHSFYTVLLLFFLFFCFISLFWFSFFFLHYLFGVYRQWRIRTLRKTNVCLTASRFLRVGPVALCICFVIQCFVFYSLIK